MAFPIILSSPSGGGKTTIAHEILALLKADPARAGDAAAEKA